MDELLKIIGDDRVSIARVDKDRYGNNQQLDKERVKKDLEVKQKMSQINDKLELMSLQERIQWIKDLKEKGDTLYKEGKAQKAMETYLEGLMGVRDDIGEAFINEYKATVCGNMAMCALAENSSSRAQALINQSMKLAPDSWRTWYRQAIVYDHSREFKKSL
jgi:tetratricopeptide (TPR) repeat protein